MIRNRHRRVALAFPVSVPWMALCLQGIADYARQHGAWTLLTSPPTLGGAEEQTLTLRALRDWPGHGVIASVTDPAEARCARRLPIPVVNLSAALAECGLPRVMVDHVALGRLGAEHLLARGLRRLAFYGFRDARSLRRAFQSLEGVSPAAYRRAWQAPSAAATTVNASSASWPLA